MIAAISIGSPLKGDDNIGNIVLEKLDIDALKLMGGMSPESVIGKAVDCERVYFIDAVDFGGASGSVHVFSPDELEGTRMSTHGFSIKQLAELLPKSKVFVIGIQPKNIDFKPRLSNELEFRLDRIVDDVKKAIQGQ